MCNRSVESSAKERLMSAIRIVAPLLLLLTAGCAEVQQTRPPTDAPPVAVAVESSATRPAEESVAVVPSSDAKTESPIAKAPAKPPAEAQKQSITPAPAKKETSPVTVAVKPSAIHPAEKSVAKAASSDAKAESAVAKVPAKPPAEPRKESATPTPVKKEGSPPLDLTALETRLKETKAIGLFTKIALKNQVDDLLDQFRAYYQGKIKTTLAALRQPYDRLVLKVLALLQDGDPALAREIVTSREAIWGILADPAKFATL
jgi:hypothetical protein